MNFLNRITTGRRERPFSVLLYGREGVGKSTWAKYSPRPIYMAQYAETDELDVERLPEVETWEQSLGALDELRKEDHPYQTLVLDTVDWLEPILWKFICQRGTKEGPVENIEGFGYGKGYLIALDEWRVLLSKLESLRNERNMNLIALAHSQVKTFSNPDGDNYDRFELKINKMAAGLLKEWFMAVLFATFETYTKKDNKKDRKAKAYGEGARIIHTQPRPAWDAKSRYRGLPPTLPLSWQDFATLARSQTPEKPEDIGEQIRSLIEGVDDVTATQARAALERCGKDSDKLNILAEWLRGKVATRAA